MSDEVGNGGGGGGFGWGFVLGAIAGLLAGAYLASGPGREQVDSLRTRTIELTGRTRTSMNDSESPLARAIQDGVQAAKKRRQELEEEAAAAEEPEAPPEAQA